MIKPKTKNTTQKNIPVPPEKKKENRGGARKGAGAKKKTPDKKRRGFYCHTTEAKAAKLGKGDWERGLQKIQKQVQKHIDENF